MLSVSRLTAATTPTRILSLIREFHDSARPLSTTAGNVSRNAAPRLTGASWASGFQVSAQYIRQVVHPPMTRKPPSPETDLLLFHGNTGPPKSFPQAVAEPSPKARMASTPNPTSNRSGHSRTVQRTLPAYPATAASRPSSASR